MEKYSPFPPVEKTEHGYEYNYLAQNHEVEEKTHPHFGKVLVYKGEDFLSYYDHEGTFLMLSTYNEETGSVNGSTIITKHHLLHFPSGEFVTNTICCDDCGNEETRCLEFTGLSSVEHVYYLCLNKKWQVIEQTENVEELHERLANFVEDLNLLKN